MSPASKEMMNLMGSKRMKKPDWGPTPEVPKFDDAPPINGATQKVAAADANASAEAKVEELRGQAREAFELHRVAFEATGIRVATLEAELAKLGQCAVRICAKPSRPWTPTHENRPNRQGDWDGTPRTS